MKLKGILISSAIAIAVVASIAAARSGVMFTTVEDPSRVGNADQGFEIGAE
jgi:hypothetical protein